METDILKKNFDVVSENIPQNQWRYFHKRSINNFILNIELIKEKSQREKTTEILFNCINDVQLNFEPNIDYSIYLFNNYLKYIVPTYRSLLGFSAIPNRYALIVFSIALITIFILFLGNFIWEILFCSLIILLSYNKIINFKKHKVYGFGY